ncbi:MAG: hypothetical protein LC713_01775 [Actinobacteria bacterium]|nr:hypothetical protein [Actinomycetota bacterium]
MAARQRRRLRPVGAFTVLALLWVMVTCVVLLVAYRDMDRGAKAVDQLRRRADAASVVDGRLLPQVRAAHARFARAHRWVSAPPEGGRGAGQS